MSVELAARLDRAALDTAIRAQGAAFQQAISVGHPHLFADVPVFVTAAQIAQMQAVIAAVELVVKLDKWMSDTPLPQPLDDPLPNPLNETTSHSTRLPKTAAKSLVIPPAGEGTIVAYPAPKTCLGVFYGYDFHLNDEGAHLIEINSNAGGGFLNALLLDSQRAADLPGKTVVAENLYQSFLAMFRNEWRLERGNALLKTATIVDEQPESQYLYPEFLLAQKMFERAGITAFIADPSVLQPREDGLYCNEQRIDLVYNRLTDFDLHRYPHIRSACERRQVVLTPNPGHHQRYADKRKLALLTDAAWLSAACVPQTSIDALQRGIPQTRIVRAADAGQWWAERRQWFFKPTSGYGGKGAYRGDKLTRRVFDEIMHSDYVAQRLAVPGERQFSVDGQKIALKYDVRCYVYDGEVQLIAARLYQGQTTNFRTPGGGFALVRVVG